MDEMIRLTDKGTLTPLYVRPEEVIILTTIKEGGTALVLRQGASLYVADKIGEVRDKFAKSQLGIQEGEGNE